VLEGVARFLSARGRKHRSRAFRLWALSGGFLVFLVLAPLLLGVVGHFVARGVPVTVPRSLEIAVGASAATLGLLILLWAVITFWRIGDGTPVPVAAPQKLVVSGPYLHCRNPIQLGAICYYLGLGSLFLSLSAGIVMFLLGLLLGGAYHKFVEEKELLLRYGVAYDDYRKRTPFLFPRPARKHDGA